MYGWIWSRLPFGLPGKIIGSVGLILGTAALLWFVVFPWAEPILPFDDVQVGTDLPADDPGVDPPSVAPSTAPSSADPFDIPYGTESNNPAPSRTRR